MLVPGPHNGVASAEGLKGTCGGRADRLAEFGRGGEKGRLGRNLGDTRDFRRNGELCSSKQFNRAEAGGCSPSVAGMWTGLISIPSNSQRSPTLPDDVASSQTWSDGQ